MNSFSSDSSNYDEEFEINKEIVKVRSISCGVSLIPCLFLMVVYIILCLQKKCNICIKKTKEKPVFVQKNSLIEKEENDQKEKSKNNKIGLGSHYMFYLILSNFLGSLFEFFFYFYYSDKTNKSGKIVDKYNIINDDIKCEMYGFAHNFFDLLAVCWTTMLTYLFYSSTNLMSEILYKDKKYLIIGFLYSIISCFIFCVIPLFCKCFGFAEYYCSFRYIEQYPTEDKEKINESTVTKIFRYSFVFMTTVNSLLNIIWLYKTHKYYSKKLKMLKKNNKNQYKLILIYVWVFRIFPIMLIISRFFKAATRLIYENSNSTPKLIFGYINGIAFASNGFFNSISCACFFRGVFFCRSSDDNIIKDEEKEDMVNLKMEKVGGEGEEEGILSNTGSSI